MKDKNLKFMAAIFVLLFTITIVAIIYRSSPNGALQLTEKESRVVVKVDVHRPRNKHEEMNLTYDVTLDNGSVMKSRFRYTVGDTIRYYTYKKVSN